MLHGRFLASPDERVDGSGIERSRAISRGVHPDRNVGDGNVVFIFVFTVHVYNLRDDSPGGDDLVGSLSLALQRHSDDIVGSHLTCDVSRIVIA